MTYDQYIATLPAKISNAKRTILKTLWEAGTTFPRNWVKSSALLSLTNQKYFDRRARELRDNLGCDIETKHYGGEHCWRLNSAELTNYNPRQYLTETQKTTLFKDHQNTCQICGRTSTQGVRGLQADHKIPLIKGGKQDISNWQPLCNECNVAKRKACADCNENCTKCSWAFPETVDKLTLINLPSALLKEINGRGHKNPLEIEQFIIKSISHEIDK